MELLKGTLDMLVLRTLLFGPLHGYGIAQAIRGSSAEALDIEFGSLYPALKRLELKGWITSKWDTSEMNRQAKFYRLTAAGRVANYLRALTMETTMNDASTVFPKPGSPRMPSSRRRSPKRSS